MSTFVDMQDFCPDILYDIRYATTNNFTGKILYSSQKCFLVRAIAIKLVRVQAKLRKLSLGLKIFDGYRPRSVQYSMWEITPDKRYIADPKIGSHHNRGVAVDVTLVDEHGIELLMPTEFDAFTSLAHRDCFNLPQEAIKNRQLLEDLMVDEGFIPLPTEWWHFHDKEFEKYPLVDHTFDELSKMICTV